MHAVAQASSLCPPSLPGARKYSEPMHGLAPSWRNCKSASPPALASAVVAPMARDVAGARFALENRPGGGLPLGVRRPVRFGFALLLFWRQQRLPGAWRNGAAYPSAAASRRPVLLILPPIVMPTAEVYRKFDAMGLGRPIDVDCEPDWLAWSSLDAKALLAELANDLEAAGVYDQPAAG